MYRFRVLTITTVACMVHVQAQKGLDAPEHDWTKIERIAKEPSYINEMREYFRQAYDRRKIIERSIASVDIEATQKIRKYKDFYQNAGLIYFKKGDMKESCSAHVDTIKAMGFAGVALYYPVHFSGGNSDKYKMPKKPIYGTHYRYEIANRPTQEEFDNCLLKIAKSGLKLHYIPHLESLKTLVNPENGEWRLMSGIPLDSLYLYSAFGPLFRFYMKHKNFFRSKKDIKLTIFSEIDPMVLSYPKQSYRVLKELKTALRDFGVKKPQVYFNTNGDFYNGWDIPQARKNVSCSYLDKYLSEISGLSPSIYGDRGHVGKDRNHNATLGATIIKYRKRLNTKLAELCPKYKFSINTKKIAFGEFALDPNDLRQRYRLFFRYNKDKLSSVSYWNFLIWDHHGVTNARPNRRFKNELFKFNPDP